MERGRALEEQGRALERVSKIPRVEPMRRARVRRVTRSYGSGRSAFLIERIPVASCPNYGENYLTAETLHKIERVWMHWPQLTVAKRVQVTRFRSAA
jgi:hypothetical protein